LRHHRGTAFEIAIVIVPLPKEMPRRICFVGNRRYGPRPTARWFLTVGFCRKFLMARDVTDTTPIESKDVLVNWLESGCKPITDYRIGTEHEKIAFYRHDLTPVPYAGERGIRALLGAMQGATGWQPILDANNMIGLYDASGGGAISLEPGGQFELSGAPLMSVHETAAETDAHLKQVIAAARPLGIGFLALGMSPKWSLAQTPTMPKNRYRIMANYMPKVGSRGLDMMFRTATVQANLDFSSEADMVKKMRVGLALQPVATALFANSPFTDGESNGFLSARSQIWRDTDNNRAGMLPFAFEPGMGFERYVDYALDVPMYFVKRGDIYHDVSGESFRDLLEGKLPSLRGERATLSDWANHVSTIFPEVRLKRYLEMRGADCGSVPFLVALPALFTGLFYDAQALDEAWQLVRQWTKAQREQLRAEVPRLALHASIAGRSLREIAHDVLELAAGGLRRRNRVDASGRDESIYLAPLQTMVEHGQTQAEYWLDRYSGAWHGSIDPAFRECVF
jgi:glutamate--cysteine ligase